MLPRLFERAGHQGTAEKMLKYKLKCWKVRDGMPTTFCEETGILFFSELFFKWKDSVPAQEREKAHNLRREHFVSKPRNLYIYRRLKATQRSNEL